MNENEEFEFRLRMERESAAPKTPVEKPSSLFGIQDASLAIGSGMLAAPIAGLAGGAATLIPGLPEGIGADVVRKVQGALTYEPQTPLGSKITHAVSAPFEWLANKADQAGGAVTDVTGSPLAGTAVNTGIQALPLLAGKGASRLVGSPSAVAKRASIESLNKPVDTGIAAAREAGYVLTPSEMKAGVVPRAIESLSGESRLNKLASVKNADITNDLIRKDIGLAEDVPISRTELARIRKVEGKAYQAVKDSGNINTDLQYKSDLAKVTSSYDTAAKDFPHRSENPFKKTMDGLSKDSFDAASALEEVKLLRGDADSFFAKGDKALGRSYREAAQALDDQILRHLSKRGPTNAFSQYVAARTRIAKTYAAEKALNDSTGNIDANVYARSLKKGAPLSKEAETVARFAQQFPNVAKPAEKIGSTGPTLWDMAGAVAGHHYGLALARPLTRAALLSPVSQWAMEGRSYGPGILQYGEPMGLAAIAEEAQRNK